MKTETKDWNEHKDGSKYGDEEENSTMEVNGINQIKRINIYLDDGLSEEELTMLFNFFKILIGYSDQI